MVEDGFNHFCIEETNPFLIKLIKQDLGNGLHLPSKDTVFISHH